MHDLYDMFIGLERYLFITKKICTFTQSMPRLSLESQLNDIVGTMCTRGIQSHHEPIVCEYVQHRDLYTSGHVPDLNKLTDQFFQLCAFLFQNANFCMLLLCDLCSFCAGYTYAFLLLLFVLCLVMCFVAFFHRRKLG